MTEDEWRFLEKPPVGLSYWDANGPLASLLKTGLLTYSIERQRVPSYINTWANFKRTEAGDKALVGAPGQGSKE